LWWTVVCLAIFFGLVAELLLAGRLGDFLVGLYEGTPDIVQ